VQEGSLQEKVETIKEIQSKVGQFLEYIPIYLEEEQGYTEKYVPESGGHSTPSIPIVEEFKKQGAKYREKGFQIFEGSREVGEVESAWLLESERYLVVKNTHFKYSESFYDDSSGPRIYYPAEYDWKGEAKEANELPAFLLEKRMSLDLSPRRRVAAIVIETLSKIREIEKEQCDTLLYILQRVAEDSWSTSLSEFFMRLSPKSIEILGQEGLNYLLLNLKNLKLQGTQWNDQDRQALARFRSSQVVESFLQILRDESVWEEARRGYSKFADSRRACELLIDMMRELGHLGDKRAIKSLMDLLERGPIGVREEAGKVLGELGDEELYVSLVKLYAPYQKRVEEAENNAIMGYGPKPSEELIHNRNAMGLAAGTILKKLSKKSIEPLIQLLESDDETERYWAVRGLIRLSGDRVVDALIYVVKNEPKHSSIRFEAIDALGRLSTNSDKAVEILIQISKDKSDPLRMRARGALERIGRRPSFLRKLFRH
jgi:HEAT repeat protein